MRVLWFTNIPLLPVTRRLQNPNKVTEGWNDALRLALQSYTNLELGVASVSAIDYEPFEEDRTVFYNILIPPQTGTIEAVYRRWLQRSEFHNGINKCLDIINSFKPDIIHIQGSEGFYGLIVKETSIPVILSIQGILSVIEKGYLSGYTFNDILMDTFSMYFIRGASAVHNNLSMKNSACREREIIRSCSYFTGRTEFDRNFVSLINSNSSYYHCDRILRPPFYSAEWAPEALDSHTIYCTTSPAPYKGLSCLLDACNILKTNGFSNIRLRVGGLIQNSGIWNFIKRKVKVLNLTNEVTWLGKSSPEMIISEMKRANVYVLPSYAENSPNSLAEAMLVGVPCVASYIGGVPSMIIHAKDGLLFPSGDSYSLAGMIAKILRDPLLAGTLSRNARITAQKRHDPQKIAATMMNIYSEIIDNSNCARR